MRNRLFASFLAFLLASCAFSQSKRTSLTQNRSYGYVNPASSHKILWRSTIQEDLPGIGKRSSLTFLNSEYDLNAHFFPIYTERTKLPIGASNASVQLINELYQPLSDSELIVLKTYDAQKMAIITSEVTPLVTISLYKRNPYAYIQFVPIRKNKLTGVYEKMVSFSLNVTPVYNANRKYENISVNTYAANSVLANGKWYKVSVAADGIYKMNYLFLKSLGMNVDSINPKNIRVYGNGGGQLPFANKGFRYDDLQQNAIMVSGENDGKLDSADYVLFYGQAQHRWHLSSADKKFHHALNVYSDSTYYFITADLAGPGKRISAQASSGAAPTNTVTSFNDFQFHESEAVNLLKSGREWLGETFDILTNYNFTFDFPNIETSSPVNAIVETAGRAEAPGTDFSWTAGSASNSFNISGVATDNIYGTYYRTNADTLNFLPTSGTIHVSVTKTTPSPSIGWLNYIEINVRRQLTMGGSGDQMNFRDQNSVGAGNISQFTVSNMLSTAQVWDVTDPINIKLQQGTFSGNAFSFTVATDTLKEFTAFNGQSFLTPEKKGEIKNQDLHGMPQSDMIIVTNPLFLESANALAELHKTEDNFKVSVATTEEIYNEFSSGAQDVSAIRDFVRMFYNRAADSTQLPKYLLLFGRGSYNVKARINNTNLLPAYESGNSSDPTLSYPADDFYGMLDTNEGVWDVTPDVLDLGIGRLPAITTGDASSMVNKIIKYTSVPGSIETVNSCSSDICYGLGDWVNYITFLADDEDNGDHMKQAEMLAQKVDTGYDEYNLDKIYLDAYQQFSTPGGERYPDATAAFMRRMDKGSLIVNYTGHGGPLGLTHERFLEIFHIQSWKNQCKLPFFFTATCDFSTWDDPGRVSAGELTLLNPDGGSIGLMSTTRVVYSGPNFVLNNYFYDHVFALLPDGKRPRLGDLHVLTKNDMGPSQINHRNFSLLADPALTLNYPDYSGITTTKINGKPVNASQPDTTRALSQVTVEGEVRDNNGSLLTDFNGIIYPTVYDKAAKISTLGNDPTSPVTPFYLQKNILFKGKASVTDGHFAFSFVVPKDIAYNFDNGRISYYAHNGYNDATGSFEDFIIGGTDTAASPDAIGPDIKLYMNDDKFVYGGLTNSEPKIYAVVSDSNGINTAGSSIGHNITAVLDEDNSKPIVLDDYYESDMDNYKRGTVRYPLTGLTEGNHSLTVKVWDVYNNSSSSKTEFVVASSAQMALKHVLNYPNPFTTKTSFFFEHNKCCTTMDVQIQIFTISGKMVKTIHQQVNMEGYRSDPIDWNGTDDFGDKIGRGVYIYRLRVKTDTGETAEQYEKLVVLK